MQAANTYHIGGQLGEGFLEERNNTWNFAISERRAKFHLDYAECEQNHVNNTPYLFNGKELDEETGLYYYGARYYNPRISLWYGVDPMFDKYPSMNPYNYCANNPVMLVDPDGREVKADEKSQRNIKNTLTRQEAKFVKFDKDGMLNAKRLGKSNSTSENMLALKDIADSETNYIFVVSDNYSGTAFFEKGSDVNNPENFSYGITMMPNAENDPSPDDNVYIFTASFLSEEKQTSNTAHEGYEHAYFYELSKSDPSINPNHTKGVVGEFSEYDPEFKQNVVGFIFGDTNTRLEK
ncbi:MAG: RHS repeat-associated core domain-containing protein [Bacteroidales bacterium]